MDCRKKFVVEPGKKVRLRKIDPAYTGKHVSHKEALPKIQEHLERLSRLQYLLYADGNRSLLVVLQAIDAGGKDGVVRHVFNAMNPQGTSVFGFKQPSKAELAHDFLWRVHQRAPGKGEVVIFNRSHYEDVLVVRVHKIVPKSVWSKRYELINSFEKTLHENGTRIESSTSISARRSSSPASTSGSRTPGATGRSARPTTPSASSGPPTSRRSRTPWSRRARSTRPGTSSLPTTSGFAISPSRRSSRTRWRRWG